MHPRQTNTTRLGLITLLLLAALALRLGWGLSRPASDAALAALPDQVEYLALARNLLDGQGLSFVDPRFGDRVHAFRMPGYPLWIAALGASVRGVRAAQAVLDTATVLAVYLLGRRMQDAIGHAGPRHLTDAPALLAAALAAFNPLLIYFSGLLLSETLVVAMIAWGMLLLAHGFAGPRERPPWWLGGGLMLALSALVRPSGALLPIVLGAGALRLRQAARRVARQAARRVDAADPSSARGIALATMALTMALLVGLSLAPWALRNFLILHRAIWTDTNAGITLYDGYNPAATGASDQRFVYEMPELKRMNELERSAYLASKAQEFIAGHPGRASQLALAKTLRTWSPIPLSEQFGNPLYRLVLLAYAAPLDLLVIVTLLRRQAPGAVKLFLLTPAIYFTLVHALTIGSLRYRLPAEPALAVLAGLAILPRAVQKNAQTAGLTIPG